MPRGGEAECAGEVRPEFFHAAGALHGSCCWKMLDDACFFAAQSLVEDNFVGTVSFSCNLLRPVKKGTLLALGRVVNRSKAVITCEGKALQYGGTRRPAETGRARARHLHAHGVPPQGPSGLPRRNVAI